MSKLNLKKISAYIAELYKKSNLTWGRAELEHIPTRSEFENSIRESIDTLKKQSDVMSTSTGGVEVNRTAWKGNHFTITIDHPVLRSLRGKVFGRGNLDDYRRLKRRKLIDEFGNVT
jgi:hypothetical protein